MAQDYRDWADAVQRLVAPIKVADLDLSDMQKAFMSGLSPASCSQGIKAGLYRRAVPVAMPANPPAALYAPRVMPDFEWLQRLSKLFRLAAWTTWLLAAGIILLTMVRIVDEVQHAKPSVERSVPQQEDHSRGGIGGIADILTGYWILGALFGSAVFVASIGGVWMLLSHGIVLMVDIHRKIT